MKNYDPDQILGILDKCCEEFTFPMLDNGYVYLAATRLSLFRSEIDWAMVIEVFGFSPRAGLPDTHIYTFASNLHNRDKEVDYVSSEAYQNYLEKNPHNESRFIHPLEEGDWQDVDDPEQVSLSGEINLRGNLIPLPDKSEYQNHGIVFEEEHPLLFELSRYLAGQYRDEVLCAKEERRISILPEMNQILQLEEWPHPDLVNDEMPSETESFRMLAEVLVTGDVSRYSPSAPANTHWSHWPDGGTL